RGAVGRVAAAAGPPVVADHALDAVQDRFLQHEAAGVAGAAGDELNGALVARGTPDVVEPGFEGEAAQVLHCPISMPSAVAFRSEEGFAPMSAIFSSPRERGRYDGGVALDPAVRAALESVLASAPDN